MFRMRLLDLTLPTAAENLAFDEALLEEAEAAGRPTETLRFWEPQQPMIVLGRSSKIDDEVHRNACRKSAVPVFRRASGGAAIVTGPGCMMYAVVLSYPARPELRTPDRVHRFVLGIMAAALKPLVPGVRHRGISDLAVGELKFSGNSIRCKRDHLLYHGTLLYDFPLELIDRWLSMPPRMPEYRGGRSHAAFMTNLPLPAAVIRRALIDAWDAAEPYGKLPERRISRLVAEKYGQGGWNSSTWHSSRRAGGC